MHLSCLLSIYDSYRKEHKPLYEYIHDKGLSTGRGELHRIQIMQLSQVQSRGAS